MRPIKEKQFVQIDITNKCHIGDCVYCSRFERHLRSDMKYEMSIDLIDKCLESLRGLPIPIGIIGGEPQVHSKFEEICELIRNKYPREKMALWTSINPNGKNKESIVKTFSIIAFNEHSQYQLKVCKHQPLTLSSKDMVMDNDLRNALIEDCWFGNNWCSSITPLGTYFCEVAATLAFLQEIKGWPIESGWWEKTDYKEQIEICQLCGACVPMERQLICNKKQRISPSFYKMLIDKNLNIGDYELINRHFTEQEMAKAAKTWRPGAYRDDIDGMEGLGSTLNWEKFSE